MEERRFQKMRGSSKKDGEKVMTPVTIDKLVAGFRVEYTASSSLFDLKSAPTNDEWELNPSSGDLYWRGYIDLSGYRANEEVFFPTTIQCQYGSIFNGTGATSFAAGGPIYLQYALTTDRLDDLSFGTVPIGEPLGGYFGDNTDMQQIILGSSESFAPANNTLLYGNIMSYQYGGGIPVVTDRIYIAIRMRLTPANSGSAFTDSSFTIPPMRFVLAGETGSVEDHEYIYLMARQYEAQKRIDVT